MSYSYETQKPELFTDKGHRLFTAVRDRVRKKMRKTGAMTMEKAMRLPNGVGAADGWDLLACIHRMEELGDVFVMKNPKSEATQHEIVVALPRFINGG